MLAPVRAARQASGRGLMLLPAGALVVHQLRYWLTYGSQASNQLADQGHSYLGSVVPWIVMLAAGGLGCFLARLALASRAGAAGGRSRPFLRLWATTGAGLLAIYSAQELLEGSLAQGHPAGLAGIFGHGGWWSVPAAALVALAIASALRVADSLVRLVARGRSAARPSMLVPPRPISVVSAPRGPLALAAAGRAPPLLRFAV